MAHASSAALLGLGIHTFFDGVAIASGLLVSTWLGGIIFIAIFLHKLPEGFTVASLMLASGRSRKAAFVSACILGAACMAVLGLRVPTRAFRAPRAETWGCGYTRPSGRMQYGESSLGQMVVGLFAWALFPRRRGVGGSIGRCRCCLFAR